MRALGAIVLLLFVLIACKRPQPKIDPKFGFLLGDWMMCKDDAPKRDFKVNTLVCPTLSFFDDYSGSLRQTDGVDIPFIWYTKKDILVIKHTENNRTKNEIIDDSVYRLFELHKTSSDETFLIDTTRNVMYRLEK